ncbi:hypothetical_protein_-_conserved [Leishmania major strain Friedlin]|nr:hypothetical_protein_-_conserved [Leishmania major strain Friedlin]
MPEPLAAVTGSRACAAAKSGRLIATDADGRTLDGVASEQPETASTPAPPIRLTTRRQRDSNTSHPAIAAHSWREPAPPRETHHAAAGTMGERVWGGTARRLGGEGSRQMPCCDA